MKVAIIGSGYVGLVTGACFAEFGYHVTSVDHDKSKIDRLQNGIIPIYEPGLEDMVKRTQQIGRLSFTTDLKAAVFDADIIFIAVGTPSRPEDGHADLTYVFQAAKSLAPHLKDYSLVVTKSTVPVGTSRKIFDIIKKTNPSAEFDVASNPEFLREGSAIQDFLHPDRVVIGLDTSSNEGTTQPSRAREWMEKLYQPLHFLETPILFTNLEASELIKYASNGFLALKVAFINEIADLCEAVGADVQEVSKGVGLDRRIGRKFLQAGPGYGGSCFPKDTLALTQVAQSVGFPVTIMEAAISSNVLRKERMAERIIQAIHQNSLRENAAREPGERNQETGKPILSLATSRDKNSESMPYVSGKTVAVLGATFKPNTDDMRDAQSLTIIPLLQQAGLLIKVYDPMGEKEGKKLLSTIDWVSCPYKACEDADIAVVLTEWSEFRSLDFKRLAEGMHKALMIDLRNLLNPEEVAAAGFDYLSVGRAPLFSTKKGVKRVEAA